jgi:hypothetical protein
VPGLPALVAAAPADVPILAWVAHSGARLEPCGCVAGMFGGLARRASLLARLAGSRLVAVECGGWSGGSADYQRLRTRTYLTAATATGCVAVGLGVADLRQGAAALRTLIHGSPALDGASATHLTVPVVCANVTSADGMPLVPDRIALTAAGRRLTITSVVPASATGDGLVTEDPATALLRLIPALQGSALVVLADLDEAGLVELARSVPGIAVVVGGAVMQPSLQPIAVGSCRVVHVANEGKTLGWWPWGASACAFELITDKLPDHPLVRRAIHDYQDRLGAMNLSIDDRIGGLTVLDQSPSSAHYAGTASCISCHAQAGAMQAQSHHARSFAALAAKGYQADPECLRCHVTGLGLPDGYRRSADPDQRSRTAVVGCEACHGRGSIHAAERAAGQASSGSLTPVTPASCVRCHDPENSPQFAFDHYWETIRHGAH